MKDSMDIEAFKELIMLLYQDFPNGRRKKAVEAVVKTQETRKQLVDHGILSKEMFDGESYSLGPNGINLVNSWKVESLTKKIYLLTIILLILGAIQIVISIIR